MKRNHRECVEAYKIPVQLRSTVTKVHGYPALTGVTLKHLDTGVEETISCDALITAMGLVPETSAADSLRGEEGFPPWLHLCGNAAYVHEIVDSVTTEALRLGRTLGQELPPGISEVSAQAKLFAQPDPGIQVKASTQSDDLTPS